MFGVVCSSFSGEHTTSYGSLLAPAMGMTLTVRRPDGSDDHAFLWELVEGGAMSVADREVIHAVRKEDELVLSFANIRANFRLGS